MKSEVEKPKVIQTQEVVSEVKMSELSKITGKYVVKPCRKSWLHNINPDHDGAILFSRTQIWIVPERNVSNPDVVTTGLTKAEQLEFEQEMNLQPGSLSPYNKAFWSQLNNIIKVPKEGLQLDCDNNIKHKLWYKLLLVNSKVAKTKEDLAVNSIADVVLTSTEQEAKIDTAKFKQKTLAYAKFAAMSQDDKINFLKVYDGARFKVNNSTKPDLIDSTLGSIVDSRPAEFLSTFEDPFYKDFILVEDLLSANIITRKGGRYFATGGEELGQSKEQIISKLRSDEYQDFKINLISKLEARK